ncbi:acyl-CoA thioesterase II [Pasteurella skyensis]|uniref:Acyl-CoA thioesterase 2 n=1 Tax=Phocoenobacter skyensis TaxID=97481 RepID=A0AAJ6P0B4_9PAST|nr:acyl-CoA thioesterase II [Pasteurella skyensis]MDP8162509.1 acyl-CoA thioesterase II [Pasteurella skyensis]MDP8172474.1 acyl-CoA thioesterase II [Pasteurella skyensis]MDP8177499.1 acyl-CoA thioesterase II [Pasteurella skyensis]MDP8178729.1 acyl-CoA thioesterase II [Pasteurella skyensis]MDP8182981.1 acyl-CoA thioesterase II [Pasteurella skyensis]
MKALENLIQLLTLKKIDENTFQGESEDLGLLKVFGGQLMAQSLSAAMEVVELERHLHSFHTYFLRAGDIHSPIIYETDILREGVSFTAVSILAKQNDEILCRMIASFQLKEEGFEYQSPMPKVEEPAALYSENELIKSMASYLPEHLKEKCQEERPFDARIKYVNNPFKGVKLPPEQFVWVKVNGKVASANQRLQQCLFTYFSDFHCLPTALHPHKKGIMQQGMRFATLDHGIWFHRDIDLNDWILYALESNNSSGGRGLTRGQVFDQTGNLLATVQQEGMLRFSS